jgi:hypothetical protein
MGTGHGYRWFGKTNIFWQEMLREKMNLSGGDDPVQLLDEGLHVNDVGGMTRNSIPQLLSKYGDKALPVLQADLNDTKIPVSLIMQSLAGITTIKATELLDSLYHSKYTQDAAWALTINPRVEAKPVYIDMLRKQKFIPQVVAIVKKFAWHSEANPILKQICAEPRYYNDYRSAFEALRDLDGRPLDELIAAEKRVYEAAFATEMDPAKRAFEIEQAKAAILTNSDKEASAVIAISFARPKGRGNTSSFATVIAAGKELFSKLPPDATSPILNSLRHLDKNEIAELRKVAPEL